MLILSACARQQMYVDKPDSGKHTVGQRPYVVNGERYVPLRTHQGYEQEGKASWYGRDFHGKATSNGERYDMYAMTAAHKTLPLGVYVRVTNLANHRQIIVKVNDRGPFVKGRIIDLSYAAAKKLGMVESGTTNVRVEALGFSPNVKSQPASASSLDRGTFSIQIGAFSMRENASGLAATFRKRLGDSMIKEVQVGGMTFFRVYAGRYESLQAAQAAQHDLEVEGYRDSFVVAID
jgi:rare lipoprotein A